MPHKDPSVRRAYKNQWRRDHQDWYRAWNKANPDKVEAYDAKYKAANKEKIAARSAVGWEIRMGRMSRAENCQGCEALAYTEAHHNDYKKRLEVVWLCKQCHEGSEVH